LSADQSLEAEVPAWWSHELLVAAAWWIHDPPEVAAWWARPNVEAIPARRPGERVATSPGAGTVMFTGWL